MVNEDPAAVIGVDENSAVPALEGQYVDLLTHETVVEQRAAHIRANNINNSVTDDMDVNHDDSTMIVLDGIVFGPFSTVHKMDTLKILQMPEVEHFVNNMKQHMETDVMFMTAHKTNLIIHRHANC